MLRCGDDDDGGAARARPPVTLSRRLVHLVIALPFTPSPSLPLNSNDSLPEKSAMSA